MKAQELVKLLEDGKSPLVLDVRTGFEFRKGHIPGAIHIWVWRVILGLADLPKEKETSIVVTCEHGPRAGMAAAALRRRGFLNVSLLEGHMLGWRTGNNPVQK